MTDIKDSFIVLGEASESDDEDYMAQNSMAIGQNATLHSVNLSDEQSSDDELHIALDAFTSKAKEAEEKAEDRKFNSLLHKKLRESNWKLKEDMKNYVKSNLKYASSQINEVNQSLLMSQVETQDSMTLRRRSTAMCQKINETLSSVLLHKIV